MTLPSASLFDPASDVLWRQGSIAEANALLEGRHYLGPVSAARRVFIGVADGVIAAAQVYRLPAARHLPSDGSWLELARWCLTPEAGPNAGSRCHAQAVRWLRSTDPIVSTLVSYSDPSVGHTGTLYRACNWQWAPTWHRLRPPPSGNGAWTPAAPQSVKDRWVFALRRDPRRADVLRIDDEASVRAWAANGGDVSKLYDERR